ncbi:RING-H2 finger protein ATL16 [Raphanus sativus]|uniref:RING-type E3 ubiquitin transferase n=1 Tax=Raphanus sativus TaxID=3726 RepID=A0A6J0N508_RAPSA|nr:RING-H2 finger protein ATL16-like [Raphanus sativus]KAJ4901749.1 RING-H2 finger protein ATL16 [Raphanus sativus]
MDFQIIAVSVIGILATALLLVACYFLVNKCLRRNDIPNGVSSSGRLSSDHDDHFMFYSPEFRTSGEGEETISEQCSACLNEFHVNETVRVIPQCFHLFHIDCVDPKNVSCSLCQTRFSCDSSVRADEITAPNNSPENALHTVVIRGEEEYEIIELGIWSGNSTSSGGDAPTYLF